MLWHVQCADFEKAGPCGQLQFAQAQCGWYRGRERGDWTQQMDLTNTERGQLWPTSDAARSCFGDWEKMLSDSERASSIMAPVRLSAGWLWEKRESEKRQKREGERDRERGPGVFQEGNFKRNRRRERNKERKRRRQAEYSLCAHPPTRCLAFGHRAPKWIHSSTPSHLSSTTSLHSLFPSRTHPSFLSLSTSLHSLANDLSVLPSLLHGQLNVRLIGHGVSGAAASALQQNNVWQATNSTNRRGTSSKHSDYRSIERKGRKVEENELRETEVVR